MEITAVICTYNRANYLRKAIQSLAVQTIKSDNYEILVVDNCSTDETKKIVTEEFSQISNLKYIYEPIQGLSQARNTGWQNAKGEYVAYLDDDAIASPHWLEKILEVFKTVIPTPGMLGGKITPIWEISKPEWLSKNLTAYLAALDWSDTPIISYDKQLLAGANVAFPKHILKTFGGFQVQLGRKGNKLLSNEEIFLWYQLKKQNYCCLYHPEIAVEHHMKASRLNQSWFIRRLYWEGVSEALTQMQLESLSLQQRFRLAASATKALLRSRRQLIHLLKKTDDQTSFEQQCWTWSKIGYVMGMWGLAN